MRPTVHDIAAAAGVSLATVDRVLNQRPGVRHVTREKVESAIRELGYVRDVAAANLAKGRTYPLVFILPASDNTFMHELNAEIRQAILRSPAERTDIRTIEVPAFDPAALVAVLEGLSREKPCGIAMVATDAPEVRAVVDRLVHAGFPIVTLVSDLTGSLRHHYAGVDNIAAGRTAARLLGRFLGPRKGKIAVLAGSMLVRDHRERLEGFTSVMAEEFPDLAILPVLEGRDDPEIAHMLIAEALGNADIVGVYSLGAGNRGLIRALKEKAVDRTLTVIAHELTAHTRAALIDNTIDAILNQNAGHEVRSAIRVLKAKADGLAVIEAQERIRLDIFLKDNLP
ncbi:probable transcriptional regulator protein, LacI family [Rhizobium etli CFN 42]|uniref:Probable transcriptional regulator protein, LacI family n=1 Tax=Rhizobium etli (strain ATCC 51251 / DSM 11541 / JCM 21823 / NBRC 15573 / CFN 42) TaxID=347834 RepID=Q2K431_RHIEC|nr:LacI family DNA-binding transcriptional regulator [Rhizobium etli]ABC92405.1 probable transcriptional regulator protein, LacI family [Rhizobium etli CFN 42]AGS23454.1 LacI family transcriptional regulator protein [Rhizobium etli bv. mimosae str. Mim1]